MKPTMTFNLTLAIVMAALAILPVLAQTPQLEYIGLAGESLTVLEVDNGGPFALGTYGFHLYDAGSATWTAYTEPGAPGRRVTAITDDPWLDVPAVTGRVDAEGHGYLTTEPLDGSFGPTTYTSGGGEVVTFAVDKYWFPYVADLWAVTRAGPGPGELLFSDDSGQTWTAVAGHGMTDLTGLVVEARYQQPGIVYLAGDGGLVRSLDSGSTWEPFDSGLPAGPVTALQAFGPAVAVPVGKSEGPDAGWLLAITADGLYQRVDWLGDTWQQVLDANCLRVETTVLGQGLYAVVVLTVGRTVFVAWNPPTDGTWTWEQWGDAFPIATPVDVAADTRIFVATAHSGVYQSPVVSGVPARPASLVLQAAPNPFNPATAVRFDAPRAGHAVLAAYDLAGRRVATLLDGQVPKGPGSFTWHPVDLSSGVYALRLKLDGMVASRRVVLVK